jgi:hypothetical protein
MCTVVIAVALSVTLLLCVAGIYTLLTTTVTPGIREWVAYSFVPLAVLLLSAFLLCSRPWAVAVVGAEVLVAAGALLVALLNHGLPHIAAPWTWTYLALAAVFAVGNVVWALQGGAG